jgi:Zn finger protein HypA/HybF involved in hydrogenase expression
VVKRVKEVTIEEYFVEQVESVLKGEARKYKTRRNDPDRIVLLPGGRIYFVEHKRLRDMGFDVAVLDTKEAVDAWIADKAGKNRCPECGYGLLRMGTLDKRACPDCHKEYFWELEKGQKRDYT